MSRVKRVSFVVRVTLDGRGEVNGVIERVATGAKEAFTGMEAIGRAIAQMLQRERALPLAGPEAPPSRGDTPSTPGGTKEQA